MYDLIVIGAGPAGAAAAIGAAQSGLRVLTIDQSRFPRHKPCTGCLSNKSLRNLECLGLTLPSSLLRGEITGVTLWGGEADRRSTQGLRRIGVMVERSRLDHWLMDQARRYGAEFRESEPVRGLTSHTDHVEVHTDHSRYLGRWVVGADGVGGPTARFSGIRGRWRTWELGSTWSASLKVHSVDQHAALALCGIPTAWGWAFPHDDGVHLGVGGSQLLSARLRCGLDTWIERYTRGTGMQRVGYRPTQYRVPAGGFHRRVAQGRVLLAGDAAGLVDPFSGEGIHLALASGQAAANAIRRGWGGSAARLHQQWADQLLPELRLSLCLSIALSTRGRVIGRMLCRSDWAVEALAAWMAGQKSYGQVIRESLVPSP